MVLGIVAAACAVAVGVACWAAYGIYSADSAWRALRRDGCSGDVSAFESHIDRTRITKGFVASLGATDGSLGGALATNAARRLLDEWDDQVKRGKSGSICGWTWVDTADDYVRFNTTSGQEIFARFEPADGRWLLVGLETR